MTCAAFLVLLVGVEAFQIGAPCSIAHGRIGHGGTIARMAIYDDIKVRIKSAMKGGPDRKAELQVRCCAARGRAHASVRNISYAHTHSRDM